MNPLEARRRILGRNVYKRTTEGNPAIAQGSLARMYLGITMQGWTEQAQYEGNQLFDASVFDGMEKSGVSVSATDGVITASGMSESAIWIQPASFTEEDFEKFKSGNIYVKNYKTSECNYEVGIHIDNTAVKEGNSPYPIPDGYLETKPNNVYFFIDVRAGIELKGSCKPMIYQDGDETYEPYTGGAPSPSPDYPQEIVSAGNYDETSGKYKVEVRLTGANLFDKSTAIKNKYISDITGGMYDRATGDTTASDYVLVEGLSYICVTNTAFARWMAFYDINKDFISGVNGYGEPIPVPQNAEYARFTIPNSVVDTFVINPGETLLPYELYKPPQTVTLTSDRPLTKWDKLEKRNGQWGWVYKSAEVVLDGTENYVAGSGSYVSDFSSNCYIDISNMVMDGRTNAFMNRLSNIDYSWVQPDAIGFSKNRNQLHVRISNSDLGTTGESSASEIRGAMKAYMAQQYEEGNPFIALYETAEETFVPLTTSEQEAMNALYTFRPTTVLSNDCDCSMGLTYKTKKSLEVTD